MRYDGDCALPPPESEVSEGGPRRTDGLSRNPRQALRKVSLADPRKSCGCWNLSGLSLVAEDQKKKPTACLDAIAGQ